MAEPLARWRNVADWAKRNPTTLRIADALGRGRGRLRVLDRLQHRHVVPAPRRPDLSDWERREASAVWLGHASVLLRIGGQTVLTDPVFSVKVGVGLGVLTAGPRRLIGLPVSENHLPKVDVLLLSHAHFDHLDRPTLWRISRGCARGARVVISERNSDLVRDLVGPGGFGSVEEVAVGATVEPAGLKITAITVKHWGARVFYDAHRGCCGYLIEGGGRRIVFGADTAIQDGWRWIGDTGGCDLAAVGIGAYDPWVSNHATPEQAAEMATHAGARSVLPMHWGTFKLSYEPMAEPMKRFRAVVPRERIALEEVGGEWRG